MEYNNSNTRKSRDQTFYNFFIILQKEYIVAELRKKIYSDAVGKAKSEEIMKGKKKKVFDIAMKNSLKTIFPNMNLGAESLYDEDLRVKLYREIYGDGGLPQFIYRDENQKGKLGIKDKKCYFMIEAEVVDKEGKVGSLQDVDFEKEKCWVKIEDEIKEYNLDQIRRIL